MVIKKKIIKFMAIINNNNKYRNNSDNREPYWEKTNKYHIQTKKRVHFPICNKNIKIAKTKRGICF